MRNLIVLAAMLFAFQLSFANSSRIDSSRLLYQSFFSYSPPGALIADISFSADLLLEHSGTFKDSLNEAERFRDILKLLRNGLEDTTGLPSAYQLMEQISYYRDQGYIPIVMLDFVYTRIDTGIYSWSSLTYSASSGQFQLGADPSSFFEEKNCKAFAVMNVLQNQTAARFILPEQLFFSNRSDPDSIFMDFGDGNGYRMVVPGQFIDVDYTDIFVQNEEFQKIELKLSKDPSGTNEIRTDFKTLTFRSPDLTLNIQDLSLDNSCLDIAVANMGDARIYIRYGAAQSQDQVLRKPFILIEGFDADINPNDDTYGEIGWSTFVAGISVNMNNDVTKVNLRQLKHLSQRLYEADYDVIFVDFKHGGEDIFKNGNSVTKLIQWVNQEKQGNEELVVMGASMGGLIARYALRMLELQDCNHCTKLYGTFDSPHLGANIPPGIQYAVRFFRSQSSSAEDAYRILGYPAARQMLIHNIRDNGQSRVQWQNWLDVNGHPALPRRIAITNGSPDGEGDFSSGAQLYTSCFKFITFKLFRCDIYAAKPAKLAFEGQYPLSSAGGSYFFTVLVGLRQSARFYAESDKIYYDHVAGSTAAWIQALHESMSTILDGIRFSNKCSSPSILNQGLSCFVPTFSALDLHSEELFFNLDSLFPTSGLMRSPSTLHPFHSVYFHDNSNSTAQGNQLHVWVDNSSGQNIDWIMSELEDADFGLEATLPNSAGRDTFNFNDPIFYRKVIPDLVIKDQALLHLNGDYRIRYGSSDDPNPLVHSGLQEFYTRQCGSYIEIEEGGKLELGDDNGIYPDNNRANLFIHSGSVLHLRSGSQLIIQEGSKLILEEGAILLFEDQAQINLAGDSAIIELRGEIRISQNAQFGFGGTGFIHAVVNDQNEGELLVPVGQNSSIRFSGSEEYGNLSLLIDGGTLKIPSAFTQLRIDSTSIWYVNDADLLVQCQLKLNKSMFKAPWDRSGTTGIILHAIDDHQINYSIFRNLEIALILDHQSEVFIPEITHNQFQWCDLGIVVRSGQMDLSHCNFMSMGESGILFENDQNSHIQNCNFNGGGDGIKHPGITTQQSWHYLEGNSFNDLNKGILATGNTSWTLKCNLFQYCGLAIEADESVLNLSSTHFENGRTGGDNTFYDNDQAVKGRIRLYMDDGYNNFFKKLSNNAAFVEIQVSQNCNCLNPALNLDAGNNYWFPAPSGSIANAGSYYYELEVLTFPHPASQVFEGSALSVYNSTCFNLYPSYILDLSKNTDRQVLGLGPESLDDLIQVYPNPVDNVLHVQVRTSKSELIELSLMDELGRVIYSGTYELKEGEQLISLDLSNLSGAGMHILLIRSSEGVEMKKIIKL